MKTKFIIVDDDELQIDYLSTLLSKFDDFIFLASFSDALEAREKIISLQPDLILLDIEMPDLNGIELIKSLKNQPKVIFITSHLEFAVEAYDLDAIDYIVKPISIDRLIKALDKVRQIRTLLSNQVEDNPISKHDNDSFFIRDNNAYVKINYDDVLYIESAGNFSFIHCKDQQKKIVLANLSKMEEQLPSEQFIRSSRSHIVNKKFINTITSDHVYINDIELNIGKQYAENLIKKVVSQNLIKRK